jgi:hypothetical protein
MTRGGPPRIQLGTGATEADFTAFFGFDYDTDTNELLLIDQDQNPGTVIARYDSTEVVWRFEAGEVKPQRGDPTTSELDDGEVMSYNSDGTGTGSAGDLVYAVNDSGTIKTSVIAQRSNATA